VAYSQGFERTERTKVSESASLQRASKRDERMNPSRRTIIKY
jgi:hypothetical protein